MDTALPKLQYFLEDERTMNATAETEPDYLALAHELTLFRCSNANARMHRQWEGAHVGERFALQFLQEQKGIAFPKDMAETMQVSSARVAALLRRLEEKGLIERRRDEGDNRRSAVVITEAGVLHINEWVADRERELASFLEEMGPHDAAEYVRLRKKMDSIAMERGWSHG